HKNHRTVHHPRCTIVEHLRCSTLLRKLTKGGCMAAAGEVPDTAHSAYRSARNHYHDATVMLPPSVEPCTATVDGDEEDTDVVIFVVGPTTVGPSSPRSKPLIMTKMTSTFQIRRGRKPTLITKRGLDWMIQVVHHAARLIQGPLHCLHSPSAAERASCHRLCRRHRAAADNVNWAKRPALPRPRPLANSRCYRTTPRPPRSFARDAADASAIANRCQPLPSPSSASPASRHAPPDRHRTSRLLDASNARHQCPMSMSAACWHVGMGVARPHRPTTTAAATVAAPPPAT
ncbi:hypothetical protein ACLOJK_019070, partial [Asimina triloba]